jgi:hypothetical protein
LQTYRMIGGTTNRAIFLGVLILNALFWLIALAGISALQHQCAGGCRSALGLGWWTVWLQFLVLIAAGLFMAGYWAGRAALLTLLAIVTTLAMVMTNTFLDYSDDSYFTGSRANAAVAGFLVFSALNLILIALVGSEMEQPVAAGAGKTVPQMTATPAANYNTGAAVPGTFTQPASGPPGYPVHPPTATAV